MFSVLFYLLYSLHIVPLGHIFLRDHRMKFVFGTIFFAKGVKKDKIVINLYSIKGKNIHRQGPLQLPKISITTISDKLNGKETVFQIKYSTLAAIR
jgi:hypothetical protein